MKTFRILSLVGLALLALGIAVVVTAPSLSEATSLIGSLFLFGLGTGFLTADALLKVTRALPAAASSTVNSTGINLEEGTRGDLLADCELLLTYPALSTTILPDTRTMTYTIQHDTDAAFGTATSLTGGSNVLQTGAGGVGAAGGTLRVRLPTNVKQYIRLQITSGASTTDASATSATLQVLV